MHSWIKQVSLEVTGLYFGVAFVLDIGSVTSLIIVINQLNAQILVL